MFRSMPRNKSEKKQFNHVSDELAFQIESAMKKTHASYSSLSEVVFQDKRQTSHLRKILEGDVFPNLRTIIRIADALDCELDITFKPKRMKLIPRKDLHMGKVINGN